MSKAVQAASWRSQEYQKASWRSQADESNPAGGLFASGEFAEAEIVGETGTTSIEPKYYLAGMSGSCSGGCCG